MGHLVYFWCSYTQSSLDCWWKKSCGFVLMWCGCICKQQTCSRFSLIRFFLSWKSAFEMLLFCYTYNIFFTFLIVIWFNINNKDFKHIIMMNLPNSYGLFMHWKHLESWKNHFLFTKLSYKVRKFFLYFWCKFH